MFLDASLDRNQRLEFLFKVKNMMKTEKNKETAKETGVDIKRMV